MSRFRIFLAVIITTILLCPVEYSANAEELPSSQERMEDDWGFEILTITVESDNNNISNPEILAEMDAIESALNTNISDEGNHDGVVWILSMSTLVKQINVSSESIFYSFLISSCELMPYCSDNNSDYPKVDGTFSIPENQGRIDHMVGEMPSNLREVLAIEDEGVGFWNRGIIYMGVVPNSYSEIERSAQSSIDQRSTIANWDELGLEMRIEGTPELGRIGGVMVETNLHTSDGPFMNDQFDKLQRLENMTNGFSSIKDTEAISIAALMKMMGGAVNISEPADFCSDFDGAGVVEEACHLLFMQQNASKTFWTILIELEWNGGSGIELQNFMTTIFFGSLNVESLNMFVSRDYQSSMVYVFSPLGDSSNELEINQIHSDHDGFDFYTNDYVLLSNTQDSTHNFSFLVLGGIGILVVFLLTTSILAYFHWRKVRRLRHLLESTNR